MCHQRFNEDTSCAMGWSNYNITHGGDFGVVNTSFDHHSTTYRHLNSSCLNSYIYSFSNTTGDSDAGYDSNTALGPSWNATASCVSAEGGSLKFYTGMRKVNHSLSIFGDDNDGRKFSDNSVAANCNDYRRSSFYKGDVGDGVYLIDSDGSGGNPSYKAFCDMTTNGGGWTRIFNHEMDGSNFFSNQTDAESENPTDPTNVKYSILNKTGNFLRAAKYEFYMTWPGQTTCSTSPHHWTQTSNPVSTSESVSGLVNILNPTDQGTGGWTGLCKSANTANTLLDGNCGVNNSWWYAVGSIASFGDGYAPTCADTNPDGRHVQLWVR